MRHLAVGIDLMSVAEVESSLASFGNRYLERVYTESEIAETGAVAGRLACRFAVKEAVYKALGVSGAALPWRQIEVLRPSGGSPALRLGLEASGLAQRVGVDQWAFSMSLDGQVALALVLGWSVHLY